MIRYSCDKCGKDIFEHDPRFEAKIEAGPVYDDMPEFIDEMDFSSEETLPEMMERLDREAWQDNSGGSFKFDLCENCYQEFCASPLLKGAGSKSGFRR